MVDAGTLGGALADNSGSLPFQVGIKPQRREDREGKHGEEI
jgi:hypothetical protein